MTADEIKAIRTIYVRGYTTTAANDIPKLLDEIERYRRALAHIADTCIQDPDTAQFAARVLDGSADVKEKP